MSALQHIKDYLASKFAGHDIETLMTHFETAIEAKVEEGLADLKQEIAELRNELAPPVSRPGGVVTVSGAAPMQIVPVGTNTDLGGITMVDSASATVGVVNG